MPLRALVAIQELLGAALERLRSQAGIEQQEMAKAMGMSAANLSRIERGYGNLTMEQLFNACDILKVEPEAFVAAVQQARRELEAGGDRVMLTRVAEQKGRAQRGYAKIAVKTLRDMLEPLVEFHARLDAKVPQER